MANRLKMVDVQAIVALLERGWSQRRIARELGVNRGTIGDYAKALKTLGAKPAKVIADMSSVLLQSVVRATCGNQLQQDGTSPILSLWRTDDM